MEYLFKVTLILICSVRYMEGMVCPVGYMTSRDSVLKVNSEIMTWSEAAMECTRMNATIITVKDNQAEQAVKDAMNRNSIRKVWIGYSSNTEVGETELGISDTTEPYFIMGNISDDQFSASSSHSSGITPKYANINSRTAWVPKYGYVGEWIQVNLGEAMCVYGIVTKGRADHPQWTTSYKLQYSDDGDHFTKLIYNQQEQILLGNNDSITPVYNNFTKPFDAQFVRLYPQTWNSYNAIRFDLLISHHSCPSDFCGTCPFAAIIRGDLQFQHMSCCSKLAYMCITETESCILTKENSSTTDTVTVNQNVADKFSQESVFSPLVIGLITGIAILAIITIILLLLLLLTIQNRKRQDHKYSSKEPRDHPTNSKDRGMNQSVAMVPPNLHLDPDPKDLYTQINVKTKSPTLPVVYYNTKDYNNATDDYADETDYVEDVLYDTPADSENINDQNKIVYLDGNNKDGIEMVKNDIYLDY
ncbi:unnamed protein product [Owenia fusiformis]|uniref:Uncharacterized protein n=1 Tax=Owenia fusiformis TaxID=6347 RepID=A0A8J1UCJ0_OWEFU|nr:unnamed protein product [Owenia fusiformis]